MDYIKTNIIILVIIIFYSCSNDPEIPSDTVNSIKNETQEMINRVKAAEARVNPMNIDFYLNGKRAQLLESQIPNAQGMDRVNMTILYASELLKSGQTEKSITQTESVLQLVERSEFQGKQNILIKLKQILAISHLRIGEQENCLNNHTPVLCVIPIADEAIHKIRRGSEKAIELLEEVLQMDPNDLQSKYLLNVAHMTLGQYPDKVPPKFLIPSNYFFKDQDLPYYTDIAGNLGIDRLGLAGGVCIDDFNNDGWLDIIASSWGFGNQIEYYENDGKGSFINKTKSAGLTGISGGLNIKHADYNNDGAMDFIILRGAWFNVEGKIPNSLIKNNGDGTFTKRAAEIGLDIKGFVKAVATGDINNDRLPDIYISILGSNNLLFKNTSYPGTLQFENISQSSATGQPIISFPAWFFDFNNDTKEDIFVSAYADVPESGAYSFAASINQKDHRLRPRLYINQGNGRFKETAKQMGMTESALTMGSNFGDLDNDGYLDIFLATGEPNFNSIIPNKVYHNIEGKKLDDVTYASGFGHIQKGHGVGFGDMDRDGDQDIYVVMGGSFEGDVFRNVFYENPTDQKHSWVNLKLIGRESNTSAIGAKIIMTVSEKGNSRRIVRTVGTGSSFGGNSLQLEIGLSSADTIEEILIQWPNSKRTTSSFKNLKINSFIEITEGAELVRYLNYKSQPFKLSHGHHHNH